MGSDSPDLAARRGASLDHVQIAAPVGCEAQARAFFGDLLGLTELAKPVTLASRGGVWFSCGAQQLHVGVEQGFAPARKAHVALRVGTSALDDLADTLTGHGHPVVWDDGLAPLRRFYTDDPFGNRLELLAVPATRLRWLQAGESLDGVLALRERVFCGEQGVSREEEVDGRDREAAHLAAFAPGAGGAATLVGTLRLLYDGPVAKVGRVAVERGWRRRGIARAMLLEALERARSAGAGEARLAAQIDAIELYRGVGFRIVSGEFVDAGIDHVWMSLGLGAEA